MSEFKDVLGRSINVGDTVAYGAGGRGSAGIRVGKIVRSEIRNWNGMQVPVLVLQYKIRGATKGIVFHTFTTPRNIAKLEPMNESEKAFDPFA